MIQLLKKKKKKIITKVRIVVTSDRERQAEGIGQKWVGRYIIANV